MMDRKSSLTDAPWSHVSLGCDPRNSSWYLATLPYNPPPSHRWIHHSRYRLAIFRLSLRQRQAGLAPTLHRYHLDGLDEIRTHDLRASSTTLSQLSHQAMLHNDTKKCQYVENQLSILDSINTNYYYIWRILLIQQTLRFNDSLQSHYCNKNQAKRPSIYLFMKSCRKLTTPLGGKKKKVTHSAVLVQDPSWANIKIGYHDYSSNRNAGLLAVAHHWSSTKMKRLATNATHFLFFEK